MRPRLLDLFCGAGGAAMGYSRAGFDVVGVDIQPQPNYPFEFEQRDALELLHTFMPGINGWWDEPPFQAIHASPPCQAYTTLNSMSNASLHPDLIGETRELLDATGLPYVIENVPGAPLRKDIVLCGASFGLGSEDAILARHRVFETSFPPPLVPECAHHGLKVLGIYGDHARVLRRWKPGQSDLNAADSLRRGREAMGIAWMTWPELREAIPPAFTELIGHRLLQHLEQRDLAVQGSST